MVSSERQAVVGKFTLHGGDKRISLPALLVLNTVVPAPVDDGDFAGIQTLLRIPFAVSQADCNQRERQIRRGSESVASEHAEAA